MKKLDFSFPIVRDIEATRAKHESKIAKVANMELFLNDWDNDSLVETFFCGNWMGTYGNGEGRKLVRTVKHCVNMLFRILINEYLVDNNKPKSWDTAYYLVHQKEFDKRMEAVSRLIYKDITYLGGRMSRLSRS